MGAASAIKDQGDPFTLGAEAPPQRRPIGTQPGSLGAIIQNFKSVTTHQIRALCRPSIAPTHIWQRNYYEHIIRDKAEWLRMRGYIVANPLHWADDGRTLRRGAASATSATLPAPQPGSRTLSGSVTCLAEATRSHPAPAPR